MEEERGKREAGGGKWEEERGWERGMGGRMIVW